MHPLNQALSADLFGGLIYGSFESFVGVPYPNPTL